MSTETRDLLGLLRPPPLRPFRLLLAIYSASGLAMATVTFALYPIFADPRPWRQKLASYVPPILLGVALGSPLLRMGLRRLLRLVREPSDRLRATLR